MSKEMNKTISHTGIYTLGNIMRQMVSFIMLPIYTRCLTPADYGVIELLSMIIDFFAIFLGLRIGEAIFRFYTQYEDKREKDEVISTALIMVGLLNMAGIMLIIIGAGPLSKIVFGSGEYVRYVVLFAFTLLFQSFIEIPMLFIRAQQKPWLFVGFSLMKLVLQLSLNIYFVVIMQLRVEGVIYSALISGGVMSLVMLGYTFSHIGMRFARAKAGKLVNFSLPLMMASLLSFYLVFGDRYFLRVFASLDDVGIYSLGYKFGFLLMFFTWQPFANIWDTQKYEVYRQDNARQAYQKIFFVISFAMILFSLGVSVFIKDLLRIMSDPAFVSAYKVVPVILAAYMVQGWTSFCNLGILLKGKTLYITKATGISVAVMTVGYLGLIPLFGAMGAAWATLIGFLARFFLVNRWASGLYDMRLSWNGTLRCALLALATFFLSLFAPANLVYSIGYHALLMVAFIILIFALPIIGRQERQWVIDLVSSTPLAKFIPVIRNKAVNLSE